MGNDTVTFVQLGPRTRRCSSCSGDKSASYYSMQPGLFDEQNASNGLSAVCNECRISRTMSLFPEDQTPWRGKASCAPWNNPRGPRGAVLSLADLDGMFFPATAGDRFVKKPWKYMCDGCPVKKECGDFGRRSDSQGVYGGEYFLGPGEQVPEGDVYVTRKGQIRRPRSQPKVRTVKCDGCGNGFDTYSNHARYCNRKCLDKVKRLRRKEAA